MFGLPNPRKLTAKEKQALGMLGTANDTHDFSFNGMRLDDGSRIPGVPALTAAEVKERVVGNIRDKGLADGFEAAVRSLALPHNLDPLTVRVTETPDWTELEPMLGKPNGTSTDDIWFRTEPMKPSEHYRITWYRYGWLKFGVGNGKVRAIRADMSHADLISPEDVPGGRSLPDPDFVAKQKKRRPLGGPPPEIDALKLLGQATQVQVTTRRMHKPDPKLDGLVRDAQSLVGRDLHPGLAQTARQLKQSFYSEYLIVTPSQNLSLEQLVGIMDETKFIRDDTTTLPGQTLKWHKYFWLEFGVVNGQVQRVRASVAFVPCTGL